MRTTKATIKKAPATKKPKARQIEQAQMQLLLQKLQKRSLTNPRQLKERIIWEHLKVLVLHTKGETQENKNILQGYEYQFRLAEVAENHYGSDIADFIKEESKSQ